MNIDILIMHFSLEAISHLFVNFGGVIDKVTLTLFLVWMNVIVVIFRCNNEFQILLISLDEALACRAPPIIPNLGRTGNEGENLI